jgi:queuosine precursor transporter
LNVLQEFFGKSAAKQAIAISLLASLFFLVMAQMHLLYFPNPLDETHGAFAQIFSSMPRIIVSSIGVYWLIQQFDYRFFGWLQGRIGALPLRLAITLVVSQTLDTLLFSFFGLYGIVSSFSEVVLISLLTKWLAIGSSVPFTAFLKKLGKPAHE